MSNSESLFHPIGQKRVSDGVVRQIMALIKSGQLQYGDQLPGERDLSSQLSISRSGVREAIRLLEAQRVLEVRPGLGTFVAQNASIIGLPARWSNWLLDHQTQALDLLEVRSALEPLAAARAAQQAKPEDVQALRETVEEIDRHITSGETESAVDGDVRFHHIISQCSGNALLIELNEGINLSLMENRLAHYSIPGKGYASNDEHRKIVEAIQANDPYLAAQAMREHIQNSLQRMRDLIARLDSDQK